MTQELHVVLGTGPAGTTLAEELLRRGHAVRTVDRQGIAPLDGVQPHAADVRDPEAAARAVAGVEVVYHCVNAPYELQIEVMPRIQESVLAAAEATGARLVVADTLYPYGPAGRPTSSVRGCSTPASARRCSRGADGRDRSRAG